MGDTPLRILHLVDSLERGGLERVVTDIAIEQRRHGHYAAVYCLYREGDLAAELRAAGIDVACAHKRDGFDPLPFWRLRQFIARGAFDLVHAHNLVPNYYAATVLRWVRRAPALLNSCHDMGTRLKNRRLRERFLWSVARTDWVAMVSDQVHEAYVGAGLIRADMASVVVNGVPTHRFTNTPARRNHARELLGLATEAMVIGCVGRLVPVKNHEGLIKATTGLLRSSPSLRLVLLGNGALREELEALCEHQGIAGQVVFAGERSDVADLLPAFDVFVLPSHSEGLSIALLEAAASALPIVATAVGGNPRIVSDGATGLLVPAGDAAALGEALRRLLEDRSLAATLGQAARDWVLANASIQRQERDFQALYERVLRQRRS